MIGVLATALLVGAAVVLPVLASGQETARDATARLLDRAVRSGSPEAFRRARQAALREHHRDLLARRAPAVLQLVEAVERSRRDCQPQGEASAHAQVACLVRQGQYAAARRALEGAPSSPGTLAVRELLDRLLALDRRPRSAGSGRP